MRSTGCLCYSNYAFYLRIKFRYIQIYTDTDIQIKLLEVLYFVLVFLREGLKGIPECGAAGVMVVLPRGRLSHYSVKLSSTVSQLDFNDGT